MLRVGLTGDLGSGKSTVARMLAERGAVVLSSDEMGRAMMQPGEPVYTAIVSKFGAGVVLPGGALDRKALARLAFAEGRVAELNAIVHPAVIAEQARVIAELAVARPDAVVVVESALIFSASTMDGDQPWRQRFDRILLVTAPDSLKVARFVERAVAAMGSGPVGGAEAMALTEEAQRRLAVQSVSAAHAGECLVIDNAGGLSDLEAKVSAVWSELSQAASTASQKR